MFDPLSHGEREGPSRQAGKVRGYGLSGEVPTLSPSRTPRGPLPLPEGEGITLSEVYPPQLPDLFHGGQMIVMGRYSGSSHAAITLSGTVGKESREFVYELDFLAKSDTKPFVEDLWARRKVGYLLEQIRLNGEKKELVEETTALAKKYGIATPYTSYLVVPDGPMPTPVATQCVVAIMPKLPRSSGRDVIVGVRPKSWRAKSPRCSEETLMTSLPSSRAGAPDRRSFPGGAYR